MFELINRITWILSICAGMVIFMIFGGRYFGFSEVFFIGGFFGIVIKFILFSPNLISQALGEKTSYQSIPERELGDISGEIHQTPVMVGDDITPKPETAGKTQIEQSPLNLALEDVPVEKTNEDNSERYREQEIDEVYEPGMIAKFFSENLLAKIGGIIVFLSVLFFLSLIYAAIGPVSKMVIGFAIGFSFYGAGVWLDKRGLTGESRIVMGLAILINYLVILSGRYLLGDDSSVSGSVLSIGMTFLFLILNTVFAVVTSLVYNSRPLLIFAFIFAYLNPILIGSSSSEPYTLLGYTMIVTLGAMFMAYTKKDAILFPLAFIFAAVLFIGAPWTDGTSWVTKLLCINALGAMSLYVSTVFKKSEQYIGEILIGATFFLIGLMGFLGIESLSAMQVGVLGLSSLTLMGLCYSQMKKGVYLYSIGTIGTILTLSPAIYVNGLKEEVMGVSVLIIVIFAIMNLGATLIKNKDLLANNLGNVISGLISGAVFLTYMMYFFGSEMFPGMMLGFGFFSLAVVYSTLSFVIVHTIGVEKIKTDEKYENTFYTVAAIGVSLFSLAVAFVFANYEEVVSIIWLLESNILFFLAAKTRSSKVALGAIVLFIIGILKLTLILDMRGLESNYGMIITFVVTAISIILNLIFLMNASRESKGKFGTELLGLNHAFHILGMGTIALGSFISIGIENEWFFILYISIIISALGILYRKVFSKALEVISNLALIGTYGLHIFAVQIAVWGGFFGAFKMNFPLSLLICVVSLIIPIYDFIRSDRKSFKMLTLAALYLLAITTLYVQYIFETPFAVTLYWGILSFTTLSYGISKNILPLRTIGLYLITLTAGKIFLYDIWMSVDNVISRVVALMVVGILMIVLSSMYTRRYGNNLNSDFSPTNLFPHKETNIEKKSSINFTSDVEQEIVQNTKSTVQTDIEKIDISGISSVKLSFTGEEKTVRIKAENLVKIAKLIANTYKKTEFKAGELASAYDTIEKDYKSSLSPAQYKKIKGLVAEFVEKGGKISFIK